MTSFNPSYLIEQVFSQVRKDFQLGMGEYFAACEVIAGGWGRENPQDLKSVLQLLWCHSLAEQEHFSGIFDRATAVLPKPENRSLQSPSPNPEDIEIDSENSTLGDRKRIAEPINPADVFELEIAPIRAPFLSTESTNTLDLQTDFPLTERSMLYHWHYLCRPVADGIPDVLNVEETIKQTAKQGFFLAPVYTRRETNHAHLIIMIDCRGSMTPFHRFTRQLVETAKSILKQVEVYYFYNIPKETLAQDPHLTEPIALQEILANCDSDTSLLMVSDAGAARGYRKLERIDITTQFLVKLKQQIKQIAWLNPMPQNRWPSTSAQIIAYLVPMYPMDNEGMSNAIDRLRRMGGNTTR